MNSILISDVNIFNGRDSLIQVNKDVLIGDGLIKEISDVIEPSDNILLVDGQGKTLMPGLIDAHVHLSGSGAVPWENKKADIAYNLQAYLYAGVTTIYDLGGLAWDLEKISRKVENYEILGPSIYHTHIPITVKNSHPIPLTELMLPWPLNGLVNTLSPTIENASEATELIEDYVKNEVDYVKIICDQIPPGSPQMTFEQMKALIDATHAEGKKAFVHIGSPQNAVDAIKAGADVLAHGVWRGKLNEDQARFIAESGKPIIYTLAGFRNVAHIHHGHFEPNTIDKQLIPSSIIDPVTLEKGKDVHKQEVMNKFFENVADNSTHWQSNFSMLYKHGAKILVGTDSNLPGTYAGASYYQELDELKNFGMSNFEILSGATYFNSKIFLKNPDFGFVEEGRKADLLLIDGNPLDSLDLLKRPIMILKAGKVIKRV